jgi:hypothetical protein
LTIVDFPELGKPANPTVIIFRAFFFLLFFCGETDEKRTSRKEKPKPKKNTVTPGTSQNKRNKKRKGRKDDYRWVRGLTERGEIDDGQRSRWEACS